MDKESRLGPMKRAMKAAMRMERNTGTGSIIGQTRAFTMETSTTTISMDKAFILGAMAGSMLGSGKTTKWMGKGHSHGLTEGVTKANILTIKSRDMGYFVDQTAGSMKGSGSMESNTGRGSTSLHKAIGKMVSGRKARESSGMSDSNLNNLLRDER